VATYVADRVQRLGSSLVNFHLIEEDGRYTLVDAGLPGFFGQLVSAVPDLHDIEAVVLTHAHPDHVGVAERVRTEAQATVHVHGADAQMARTGRQSAHEHSIVPYLVRPATWRLLVHAARNGATRIPRIEDVRTFQEGALLDVPGRLRVIHTPGHSHGHCSLLCEDRGVLFAGDALCNRNPLTGRDGPQIMPAAVNASSEQALASLERLETLEADVVLFGHGDPWTQGARTAVQLARTAGLS